MPDATDRRTPRDQRPLALAGMLAPAVFVLGVVISGLTWSGYEHRTQNISDLGGTEAPQPVLLNVTLLLFGLLVVTFAVALRRGRADCSRAPAGPLLVGYFGVTAVVQGLTPCTPGCAEGTPADLLHGLAATTGLLAVALGMLSSWWVTRATPGRSFHSGLSAWTGTLTLGLLVAWLIAAGVDPQRLDAGVLQRALIGMALIWLAATAVQLRRRHRAPPATANDCTGRSPATDAAACTLCGSRQRRGAPQARGMRTSLPRWSPAAKSCWAWWISVSG